MGWFVVNILLPISVPMLFMKLAGLVPTLPADVAARTRLMLLVQDGQLGWVALGFSASCLYDALAYLVRAGAGSPSWVQPVFGFSIATLVASGFLAALGALFPAAGRRPERDGLRGWIRANRVFLMTATALIMAAAMRCIVYYNFSV